MKTRIVPSNHPDAQWLLQELAQDIEYHKNFAPAGMDFVHEQGAESTWQCEIHLLYFDNEPVGFFKLSFARYLRSAIFSYAVRQGYRGRGFGTRLIDRAIERAFKELGLHRLEANVFDYNEVSLRLIKRRFVLEGRHRDDVVWRDKYHDMYRFALLTSDLEGGDHATE